METREYFEKVMQDYNQNRNGRRLGGDRRKRHAEGGDGDYHRPERDGRHGKSELRDRLNQSEQS